MISDMQDKIALSIMLFFTLRLFFGGLLDDK
jgi:hypothetical protein